MASAINLKKILQWTNDDTQLFEKLREWRLIAKDNEVNCEKCGAPMRICSEGNKTFWRCFATRKNAHKKKIKCANKVPVRKNSLFEHSHLSFEQWLYCSEIRKIMLEAAAYWNRVCQEIAKQFFFSNSKKIGGKGKIVEIDESKFGKRKYHRGHSVEGQWVFGGIERESGDMFLVTVKTRDAKTLLKIIHENILPGTTIYSDCWKAYNKLNDVGYEHYTVNHSKNFKDPETGVHTNTIECAWRHAKHRIPEYRRDKGEYSVYFARYLFITHCRKHKLEPFDELMKAVGNLHRAYGILVQDDSDDDQ